MYVIREVDGETNADILHRLNRMAPETFPELSDQHLENGFWWIAYLEQEPVAFAGLVDMDPFPNVGYLKRAYVIPDHRGHGLQGGFRAMRESKVRAIGWTHLVSECGAENRASARNFERAGFLLFWPPVALNTTVALLLGGLVTGYVQVIQYWFGVSLPKSTDSVR
jgi:GNAT superfamily N-acetyltransferase